MAVSAVRNLTLSVDSNVRWFYFEANLTEDPGNWVEMKMQKNGYNDQRVHKRSDSTVYSTDTSAHEVYGLIMAFAEANNIDTGNWQGYNDLYM
tara:strand:- start:1513 stop:1791 length:279 start_codon:yes stop_codon:yes gene_type:complete